MGIDSNVNIAYGRTPFNWCYALSFSGYISMADDLIDGTISTGSYAINDFFTSFSDYITKLQVFPFSLDNFFDLSAVSSMYLGKTTITKNGYSINNPSGSSKPPYKEWFSFTLTRYFNNFLDYNPYTKIRLYIPFFDIIDLPLEQCYGYQIICYLSIDKFTGKASIFLFRQTDGLFIYSTSTKLSLDIPMGKSNAEEKERNNILQSISALGSLVGLGIGVSTGNPLITAGSVGLLTKNVTSAMNNNVDRLSSYKGSGESFDKWVCDKSIYLIIERPQNVTYPDLNSKGRPLREVKSLSAISGYTEIGTITFDPNGEPIYEDEINEIIDLLRTGVILP